MAYNDEQLSLIYDRTTGYCHLCGRKLARTNYGRHGERGAWEVEHSVARSRGGTERLNNLYAACISCNRSKQARSTRSCRAENGRARAPLSRTVRIAAKQENAIAGGAFGAVIGLTLGPLGAVCGAALGAYLGHQVNPDG